MSDISIPGVSSKYNTTQLVEDLVEAERIRLTRMEDNVTELETNRTVWQQVSRDLGTLQRTAKSLYGFENPFSERVAESSNERVLTASATRTAPFDTYEITVKQTASSDSFMTPSLNRSFRVEAGDYGFQVGDESVSLKYRGGTLDDFARRLSEKGGDLVRASVVRDTSSTQILLIEAVPSGAENRLQFTGDSVVLGLQTGMMERSASQQISAGRFWDTFQTDQLTQITETGDGKSLLAAPGASVRIPFDAPAGSTDNMVLEYRYRTIDHSGDELLPSVPPGPLWPEVPDGQYQGIVIRSTPNSFELPEQNAAPLPERRDEPNVFLAEGAAQTVGLPPVKNSPEFETVRVSEIPEGLNALVLNNANTHRSIEITGIRVYNPSVQGGLEAVSPVETAADAIVEFRGIEARRPSNTIDDLVDGLTLELKRASDDPVELSVGSDAELAKESVIRFVFSYNQMMTRLLVLTSDNQDIIDELEYLSDDERTELQEQLGSFRGDMTLNQVRNRLQMITADPYPSNSDLRMLAQAGVSTNASSAGSGSALNTSKLRGYLEINEEVLDKAIAADIDAIKDLFGQDTDGDLIIDTGVARAIDEYLTPYTQTGGFVRSRLTSIDDQIKGVNDDIADYEEYLEDYEADLKRQYGNMEAALSQLENSSRELNNFSSRQNSN